MTRMRRLTIAVAVGAAALLPAALVPLEADDPVGTSITFNREIIRIIQRKCEPCHAQGGLAMSLSDFRDARAWGRAIREELVEHRMPPAILARGYGEYETDPSLNAREMATFLTWLDGGMPRGDEADLPARPARADIPAEPEGPGSVRVALPLQTVPARENLVVRRVVVDAGAAAGLTVARVQLRPGNPRVLRGALVFAATSAGVGSASAGVGAPGTTPGALIGAWVPWQHAIVPPSAYGFELPAHASLVADLYYRGADTPQADRSAVELIVSRDRVAQPVRDVTIESSEQNSTGFRGRLHLRDSASVWAIHPALDASVASFELRVERPDQSVEVLLWVPTVRPEWPLALVTREPVALPAGSIISFVAARNQPRAESALARAARQSPSGTPPRVVLSLMR